MVHDALSAFDDASSRNAFNHNVLSQVSVWHQQLIDETQRTKSNKNGFLLIEMTHSQGTKMNVDTSWHLSIIAIYSYERVA